MKLAVILLAAVLMLGCAAQGGTNVSGGAPPVAPPAPPMAPPSAPPAPPAIPPGGMMNNSDIIVTTGPYEVAAKTVNYFDNTSGYLARPEAGGSYPGIVMIHEWWGLNDNIKDMARKLASHGYVVLAVDLHGGKVATTPEEARALTGALDQEKAIDNMQAAAEYMRENESAEGMASLGWCFGGGQSMQLALSGEDLDATVIYYGTVVTNESDLADISWPVLGIFGEEDTAIPVAGVREFDSRLDSLDIENEIYIYPGVGHAFANPSGMNYAPAETKDAWNKTVSFLDKHFK